MYKHRNLAFGLGLTIALLILLACAPPSPGAPAPTSEPPASPATSPVTTPAAQPSVTLAITEGSPTPSPTTIAIVPLTPSASSTPAATLAQSYDDAAGFWSIRYPAGWMIRQSGSETQFRPAEISPAFLGVSLHVKVRDPEPFARSIVELLRSRATGWQTLDQGPTSTAWAPGWQVGYRRTTGGEEQQGILVCFARYRIGYVVLGEGPPAEFTAHQPTFETMVASFRPTDFPDVIPYEQWETRRTEHLVFHYPPNSPAAGDIDLADRLYNAAYDDNAAYLGITLDRPIDVYLYPTGDTRYHMTARDAGFAMIPEYEVHSLWAEGERQTPGHEVVHVLTGNGWGEATEALLGEGIAVWLDHNEAGRDYHRLAADMLADDELLPIRGILGDGWFQHDGNITYPEAGSFVGFMLESFGVSKFKRIYLAQDFEAELQAAVGWTLSDLEAAWHDYLRKH